MERNEIIEQMKEKAKEIISTNDLYDDYNLEYILSDKNNIKNAIGLIANCDEIEEIDFRTNEISPVAEWAYNIDEDIFGELEKGKEIAYMDINCHYGIWTEIEEYYPEDIEYKKGLQEYLKYCKANNITKEKIGYDGIDIMNFLKPKNKERGR